MNDDLHGTLREASEDAPHHQLDLAATVRRGTKLRRQRTIARGVGVLASLALLGGAGVVGVQTLAPRSDLGQSIAGPPRHQVPTTPTAPPPTSANTKRPAPSTSPTAARTPQRTQPGEQALTALRDFARATTVDLLAPYGTAAVTSDDTGDSYYTSTYDLTDGQGTTQVTVFISRGSDPEDPDDLREKHPTSCDGWEMSTCQELPDGSLLVTGAAQGYAKSDPRNNGEVSNFAQLYRPDRVVIRMSSSNGTGEKGRQLRDAPPITQKQLTKLVTDPIWDDAPVPE